MAKEFSEISNDSIWRLIKNIAAIGDVLKNELPFDYLAPNWHMEDGTEDFTIGISATLGERRLSLTIYTRAPDEPPEPREMYPPNCCAVGTLQIYSSESLARETLEVCGTPYQWMVHHGDKWMPLSACYVAFLMGINQKLPGS